MTTHRQARSHIQRNVDVTEPAPHTLSTHSRAREAVAELLICREKLLSSILPAEIHFSEEIRPRYCCYSNSQSHLHSLFPTTSPWILWAAISIMHREWPRLSQPFMERKAKSSLSNRNVEDRAWLGPTELSCLDSPGAVMMFSSWMGTGHVTTEFRKVNQILTISEWEFPVRMLLLAIIIYSEMFSLF